MKSKQLLRRREEAFSASLASTGVVEAAPIDFPAYAFVDQAVWGAGPVRQSVDVRSNWTSNHQNQSGVTDARRAGSFNPEFSFAVEAM